MLGILYFTAPWCGPCKQYGPLLKRFCEENNVELMKVDVEKNQTMAARYDVMSLPTIIWYANGKPVQQHVGPQTYEKLQRDKQYLSEAYLGSEDQADS